MKKILHVDDDEHTLRTVSNYLERRGYRVVSSSTPFIAPIIAEEKPDLLLLDLDMPLLKGDRIASIIREKGFAGTLPIIFFSGRPLDEILEAVSHLPAANYVKKEAGLDALLKEIGDKIG